MRGPPGPPTSLINATQPLSAFSVVLGKIRSSNKTLRFLNIVYNRQQHYDSHSGLFTCSIPGVYQFSFLCISYVSHTSVSLWHNNKMVLQSFRAFVGRYLLTGNIVLKLEAGDTVYLQSSRGSDGLSSKSFFTGHLLFTT